LVKDDPPLEPIANNFRSKSTPYVQSVSLGVVSHSERHQGGYGVASPGKMVPVFGVKTIRATVLFADMRGYTGLAETLPPARVLPLLNEFFGMLARVTEAHDGEVFYMAGDGMMAGFGVRDPKQQGAREALAAGRTMQQRFSSVAARWQCDRSIMIGIGIGLHLGEVALGLLGPPGKGTVTLVGDTANVAARLCSRARNGEVLFSSTVAAALDASPDFRPTTGTAAFLVSPQFALRGRSGLVDIWCLPPAVRKSLTHHMKVGQSVPDVRPLPESSVLGRVSPVSSATGTIRGFTGTPAREILTSGPFTAQDKQ
jgi:class 3 adenylate cyclase